MTNTTVKRQITVAATTLAAMVAAGTVVGCGVSQDAVDVTPVPAASATTYPYTGSVATYDVEAGTDSLTVVAIGGSGGQQRDAAGDTAAGAQVTGTIAVQQGQKLLISVGQVGSNASTHKSDPPGGWGGLGASGGNGKAESDDLRTSGGGGGATTVQLTDVNGNNPQTIMIAGGGGGNGGASGDPLDIGTGGNAGCTNAWPNPSPTPVWAGSNGMYGSSSSMGGGAGGTAAAEPGSAGGPGLGGTGLGGDGGGGGGGLNGGSGGHGAKGTSAGGGGGAGSSMTANMTQTSITCAQDQSYSGEGDGQVTVTPGS